MTVAASSTATPARSTRSIVGVGALAAVAAAAATTAVAAIAKGMGVPLEAAPASDPGPQEIPILGFAMITLVSCVLGVLIALACARWARRPERTFLIVTVVLTVLSFAPSVTTGHATVATKTVLVLTHIVAALIFIPVMARRLAATERSS